MFPCYVGVLLFHLLRQWSVFPPVFQSSISVLPLFRYFAGVPCSVVRCSGVPSFKACPEIGTLYKVSISKFFLAFGSKTAKEKFQGTEVQCRFGDSEICLNFRKRICPLRNGRKPIFVTILLPEFISDQVVRLAFSNFRKVVSVFK